MRRPVPGWAPIVLVCLALSAGSGRGQGDALGYALPDVTVPSPLASTRPETGIFFYGTFAMYEQFMPLKTQRVASRGIFDITGELTGTPRTAVGPMTPALDVDQVTGPKSQQPGFHIGIGYRFEDGSAIDLNWLHLNTQRYTAVATPIPQNLLLTDDLSNSFLFSPVSNFPLEFSGPQNDTSLGPAFGIWNGADLMTIDYTQRNELYELIYRLRPVVETDTWRTMGYFGPRFVWFWERFRWRTFDLSIDGGSSDVFNAYYTNIISNRMYGLKMGCQNDWYVGNGLSCTVDVFVTPMLNVVKKRAKYERGDRNIGPENKRADRDFTLVPELGAKVALNWFPYEGIQVKASYDLLTYFNTVTSEHPIDFDYSALNPEYDRTFRYLRGFEVGVMIRF